MWHRIFQIIACALLCTISAQAAEPDPARVRELAHSKRWLRILHYKSYWFAKDHSTIDGKDFFFSPEGVKDPEKEMWASIAAFKERPNEMISKLKQPLLCAFPARFRFLNEELKLGLSPPKECAKWNEFLAKFHGAESVTLIFSTAYPNNPASMFGHSFLRINGKADAGLTKLDLLDTGLSYAAQVPDDANNFAFVWFGLTGGYIGTFSAIPYYAKVQEYNNSESRDLWEYNLNFNQDDTWWLLAAAWELEVNSYSDYYFFDENCSYEILTLVEVAKPEWNVASHFMHMIPGETVKKVTRTEGAVKSIKYRPSLYKKLMALGERLSSEERKDFFRVIAGESLPHASVATLDTANQYFLFLKQQKSGKLNEQDTAKMKKILSDRAALGGVSPPEPEFDQTSRPELGHHASRFSAGLGSEKGSSGDYGLFQEFEFKFAYHDLLNHDIGYVPYSEISFPHIFFRYFPSEKRFNVHRIDILGINSMSPWNWLKNALSWRLNVAYEVPVDICGFCHVMHAEGNAGISQSFFDDKARTYQLMGLYAELGKPLTRKWRTGAKVTVGLIANITKNWKHQWEGAFVTDPWRLGSAQSNFVNLFWGQSYFLSQAWEARVLGRALVATQNNAQGRNEAEFQFLYYF